MYGESVPIMAWMGPVLKGAVATIEIAILAYLIGFALGLIVAVAGGSRHAGVKRAATVYVGFLRAVPELVLIIVLYYAGTQLLTFIAHQLSGGSAVVSFNGFVTAVGVLAIVQSAFMGEVLRGAIAAVPVGQLEAADAYGFTRWKRFWHIVLPGMIPNAIPGMSNLWLILLKDTSLISIVGYQELFFTTQQAAASTRHYFTFYAIAALIYLILSGITNGGFRVLERHYRRGQKLTTEA
ncbi:MAG TPA: ABC transporter permease subunit [Nevskiaceae bacterium]|nr:ABC transporter permease subunit [Nevskiaceae bacterium]